MKLWLKISLVTAVSVSLLMGICSGVFVYQTASANIQIAVENHCRQFENTRNFIQRNLKTERLSEETSQLSYEVFLAELMKTYGSREFVLLDRLEDDREIYNMSGYRFHLNEDWTKWSADEGRAEIRYMIQSAEAESVLVIGAFLEDERFSEEGNYRYYMSAAFDLTDIYANVQMISSQFLMITLIFTALLSVIIIFLVRLLLRLVKKLEAAALAVSGGDYGKRIEVKEQDEIGMVSHAFNEMAAKTEAHVRELEDINQRQKILLGSLTHELKTPMTSVIGYADTLLHVKLKEERRQKALIHIYEEGKRMERLCARLMELIGRYDNDAIELKEGAFADVLERACNSIRHRLEEKQMTVVCDCDDSRMPMDADLIEELLINLMDNSIKASGPGSQIIVSCHNSVLEVTDQGRGIPSEELSRITDPFYMVDKSRSRRSGGIGLGLYIAGQIIGLHGGTMQIESTRGKGTTVKVVFDDEK